jgi:hypothetical protein
MSKAKRRTGVIVNYFSLLLFLIIFYVAERTGLSTLLIVTGVVALVAIVISFIFAYVRTRLWKLVHRKVDELDERQVQITHESLRYSYGIFSVICLAIILASELIRQWSASADHLSLMPILAALIYLAHTLPASVLAWTEKEV